MTSRSHLAATTFQPERTIPLTTGWPQVRQYRKDLPPSSRPIRANSSVRFFDTVVSGMIRHQAPCQESTQPIAYGTQPIPMTAPPPRTIRTSSNQSVTRRVRSLNRPRSTESDTAWPVSALTETRSDTILSLMGSGLQWTRQTI